MSALPDFPPGPDPVVATEAVPPGPTPAGPDRLVPDRLAPDQLAPDPAGSNPLDSDPPDPDLAAAPPVTQPGLLWYLTEPTRAVVDIGQFAAGRALLRAAPSGDGHTVLVLPGLGTTDRATAPLRRFLAGLGYDVHGWGLGRNIGPSVAAIDGMRDLLRELAGRGKVSLVGWSLGGVFARELARERPGSVRQVITLGSPYALADPRHTRVDPVYRLLARFYRAGAQPPPPEHTRPPFPVPATSVYSRSDGIVPWRSCVSPESRRHQNVAVASSHLGYGYNATVLWVVADRLAQRPGRWRPFTPPPGMARMFPAA